MAVNALILLADGVKYPIRESKFDGIIAVTNKHTAKLHHVVSLYILLFQL